jgi:TolB-like protein/class 3 adenylate cyclase/lipoprotein NlpI
MRKLAAIVFTDIVGYTALSAQDEKKAFQLLTTQRELLKPIVEKFDGAWMKEIGDGLLLTFSTVTSALQCAIEIQHATQEVDDYELRIGIHQGDIIEESGDVFGDDVNVASRIEPFAAPGGIAISQKVQQDISSQPEFTAKYLGQPKLKGVKQEVKVYCITSHGLPETKPSEISAKLERRPGGRIRWAVPALVIIAAASYYLFFRPEPAIANSIAVLPLENLMGDPTQDWFVEGMHDALITDLSKINALRVISRTSAMHYKGVDKPLQEIASELGVDAVVEGSILRAEEQVRITVQLIAVDPERHLWAHNYERDYRDIIALQREVAQDIARRIQVAMTPEEEVLMAYRSIENIPAYEAVLRARYNIFKWTRDAQDQALLHLQRAQDLIGDNALIYSSMAFVHAIYADIGIDQEANIDLAEAYAGKALELDPRSSEAHHVLGFVNQAFRGNQKKSFYHLERALELNPNNPDALIWLTAGYALTGKTEEAQPLVDRALEIDPLTPLNQIVWGLHYYIGGQFETALERFKLFYQQEPSHPVGQWWLSRALAANQRAEEVDSLIATFPHVDLDVLFTRMVFFLKAAIAADTTEMEQLLIPVFTETMRKDPLYSEFIASTFALAGLKAQALDWMENAVDRGLYNYPFIAEYNPFLANLQGEERFQQLLERVKYEWEQFDD